MPWRLQFTYVVLSMCISDTVRLNVYYYFYIITLTFHMPKPPQSTPPHHLIHALYTQKTVQIHTAFPILQRHSAHSSHHHPFHPLQTMQIRFLHCPDFSPICCKVDWWLQLELCSATLSVASSCTCHRNQVNSIEGLALNIVWYIVW